MTGRDDLIGTFTRGLAKGAALGVVVGAALRALGVQEVPLTTERLRDELAAIGEEVAEFRGAVADTLATVAEALRP